MDKLITIVILAVYFVSCSSDENTPVKNIQGDMPLIIVIGQSNADGAAPFDSAPKWLKNNEYKVDNYYIWGDSGFNPYQLGYNTGCDNNANKKIAFDIFFAKKYISKKHVSLLCIKHTKGGTPISELGRINIPCWQADYSLLKDNQKSMMKGLNKKIKDAYEYAKSHNINLKPTAILFLQGESDASNKDMANEYKKNLLYLIKYVRSLLGSNNIPFINAEIMYKNDLYIRIDKTYEELNKVDPYFKTIKMDNYQFSIGDGEHYNIEAQEYIGNTMYDYLQNISVN